MPNPYEVLGVTPAHTQDAIKTAYRAKARHTHPDAGGDVEAFQTVQWAYDILGDPDKRAHFDATGEEPKDKQGHRHDALKIVGTMMQEIIPQLMAGPCYEDAVAKMREAMAERIDGIAGDIGKMRADIPKLEAAAKRFISKGPNNALAAMVRNRITGIEANIPRAEHALALHKLAAEILEDYSFEADAPPATEVFENTQWATSTILGGHNNGMAQGGLGMRFVPMR
jgi:curved DNA-binding protein CbpA